ncbi:MAG: hypothetical protein ACM3NQ_03710 [Bacteroidales bacterium]
MTSDSSLPQDPDGLSVDGLRRELDAHVEVETRLRKALVDTMERHRGELADAADRHRGELADAEARHRHELADAQASAVESLQRARVDERECDMACMEKLVAAIRDLDDAATLSLVLDRLTAHAAAIVAGRVMTFVVKESALRRWKSPGADASEPCAEIPLTGHSVAAVAARRRSASTTRDQDEGQPVEPLACAPLADDRVGLAVPLVVGGQTAVVLYADDVADSEPTVPSAWPEVVEVIARHAASCLERLTVTKAYGLHTSGVGPFGADPMTAPRAERPGSPGGAGLDEDSEDESAQRYARLLISEIKLYHEDEVAAGCRDANLLERLGPAISRARTLYEQRVPVEVRARNDYFGQELVRTLADGERRLLGLDT